MKNIAYSILILTIALANSCSSDNNINDTLNPGEIETNDNYFPSTPNDYWNYNVTNIDNTTNETIITQDSLYVVSNSQSTFMLDANNGIPANGPIIGLLSSGTLTNSNTTLVLDGALELPAEITDLIDFDIALNNFVLYNTEASINTVLASNTNTITQDFNGYPLTITYQLTSTALDFNENLSLNGVSYSDVVSSKLALNLSIATEINVFGFPIPLAILDPQDILVSTNYYAVGIGLVQANSNTSYQISPTAINTLAEAEITLPIPSSGSAIVNQEIADYYVEIILN
ncbi:hypothetical protein [Lacinutrix mariniflava]|uniref:hypothetical protein n=1 Tax=Lacinutrix mariniflava TaxID=342955 RepID=UPI0006E1EDDB|nr:hypothetical protein [Lacinutrix mariniflava]